jgi:hypothetical protein
LIAHDIDPPKFHDLDRLVQRLPDPLQAPFVELDLPDFDITTRQADPRATADDDQEVGPRPAPPAEQPSTTPSEDGDQVGAEGVEPPTSAL